MTDEEVFREFLNVAKLDDIDLTERDYDYLRESARFQSFLLCYRLRDLGIAITASMEEVCSRIYSVMQKMQHVENISAKGIPRTPVDIKKDIKREKNPMRLKQLNKELNDAYKSRIGRKR
jgi:hypothetical protein